MNQAGAAMPAQLDQHADRRRPASDLGAGR
jgi:hypothetical protein